MTEDLNAIRRELPEPEEGKNPWPYAVWLFFGIMIGWGATYMALESGHGEVNGGDRRTLEVPGVVKSAPTIDGKTVYNNVCSACHQGTGLGVPGAFPPLAGSEWVLGDPSIIAKIVLKGLMGPIKVSGQEYNGVMPAFEGQLKDEAIAAVVSFVRGEWGNEASLKNREDVVEATRVAELREELKAKSDSFTAAELGGTK
jgi:mono/diheme cytochrome c family protein